MGRVNAQYARRAYIDLCIRIVSRCTTVLLIDDEGIWLLFGTVDCRRTYYLKIKRRKKTFFLLFRATPIQTITICCTIDAPVQSFLTLHYILYLIFVCFFREFQFWIFVFGVLLLCPVHFIIILCVCLQVTFWQRQKASGFSSIVRKRNQKFKSKLYNCQSLFTCRFHTTQEIIDCVNEKW